MSESVLPIFFSKSFIVSGLTLRSLIHVEFIFMYSAESVERRLEEDKSGSRKTSQ